MNNAMNQFSRILAVFIAIVYLFGCIDSAHAGNTNSGNSYIHGEVINISDGDTITVLTEPRHKMVIRMYGIDTPEKQFPGCWDSQSYSDKAKAFAQDKVLSRTVTVRLTGTKTYGRYVGEIFYDGYSLSRELLRNGLAWWAEKYAPDDYDLGQLEGLSRKRKIGLWQEAKPVSPWEYRQLNKNKSSCRLR